MNKELIQKAIEHIAQPNVTLGAGVAFFPDESPCCTLGHMAIVAGVAPSRLKNNYAAIGEVYGLTTEEADRIWETNDRYAFRIYEERKRAVLDLLNGYLEADPT